MTSGSSPASLTTAALGGVGPESFGGQGERRLLGPSGSVMRTGSGNSPVSSAVYAAVVAAVAHAPVVQP